jgi:hypothetical protein
MLFAMDRIVTLSERKQAEAQRRQQAVASLKAELSAYARARGGRFVYSAPLPATKCDTTAMWTSWWILRQTMMRRPGTSPNAPVGIVGLNPT